MRKTPTIIINNLIYDVVNIRPASKSSQVNCVVVSVFCFRIKGV